MKKNDTPLFTQTLLKQARHYNDPAARLVQRLAACDEQFSANTYPHLTDLVRRIMDETNAVDAGNRFSFTPQEKQLIADIHQQIQQEAGQHNRRQFLKNTASVAFATAAALNGVTAIDAVQERRKAWNESRRHHNDADAWVIRAEDEGNPAKKNGFIKRAEDARQRADEWAAKATLQGVKAIQSTAGTGGFGTVAIHSLDSSDSQAEQKSELSLRALNNLLHGNITPDMPAQEQADRIATYVLENLRKNIQKLPQEKQQLNYIAR